MAGYEWVEQLEAYCFTAVVGLDQDEAIRRLGGDPTVNGRTRTFAECFWPADGPQWAQVGIVGDGLLVATPIGSTGYNRSAGGPVLPRELSLLALTGLAVHRRSDWSNTIVSNSATIEVEVLEPAHRPVRLETSLQEVTDVSRVRISCDRDTDLQLLFDGSPSLQAPGEAATAALAAPLLPAIH